MFGRNPTGGPLPQSVARDQECFPEEATVRKRSLMAGSSYRLGHKGSTSRREAGSLPVRQELTHMYTLQNTA